MKEKGRPRRQNKAEFAHSTSFSAETLLGAHRNQCGERSDFCQKLCKLEDIGLTS